MTGAAEHLLEHIAATKRPLSAQHDYITSGTRYREASTRLTGHAPAIFGSDLSFLYGGSNPAAIGHCGPANLTEPGHGVIAWAYAPEKVFAPESLPVFTGARLKTLRAELMDRCIALHRSGTLITLMWHCPRPGCGDIANDGDLWVSSPPADSFWDELFDETSPTHFDWCAQVDRVAAHLTRLRDAGVPVLWRPYHEMNGGWFWWGNRPQHFPRLWRMLRDRMERIHKLDHLVWVWNPNAPRATPGDEAGPYADYYPGADAVDVLAADVYHDDFQDSHHEDLLALANGKPIALGEVGHLPAAETLDRQPHWAWIMPWGGLVFRFNAPDHIQRFYSHILS